MLKLHQIFFRRFILLFVATLSIVAFLTYSAIKSIEFSRVEDNLKSVILVSQLQIKETSDLENFAKILKKATTFRVTIIDINGTVVAETDKNKALLANHSNRVEIQQARVGGFGKDIRKSDTVNKDMMYVAKKLQTKDGVYFLRIARYVDEFNDEFMVLSFKILFLMSFFLGLGFFFAYRLNNQIKDEIDKIASFLRDLLQKNFDAKIESEFSNEFYKISSWLTKVAQKLKKREEKKEKQTKKLKLLNKQKDEIISAISHEFKNPIAVINGYCETLLNDKDMKKSIMEKFLKKIGSNATRLSEMIDRLRIATKLEDKKFQATFKECNLAELCGRIVANLKVEYSKREIYLKVHFQKQILADEILLGVAVANLIENAIKYSENDVFVEIYEDRIDVVDDGIGIASNEIEKITDKFYRVDTNSWNNSLGLGLSIVTNILRVHGFALEIKSEIGKGSVFSIIF